MRCGASPARQSRRGPAAACARSCASGARPPVVDQGGSWWAMVGSWEITLDYDGSWWITLDHGGS
eukprot:scaffold18026_cov58-Phaeocystis_antarctica.AAC.1